MTFTASPALAARARGLGELSGRGRLESTAQRVRYCLRMNADAQDRCLPTEQVELAVEIFRMLADGTRIRLLWALRDTELSVNQLAEAVGKPGPAVSQHLAKLRMARMVRTRREGNQVFYRVENDHIASLVRDAVENAEHATDAIPAHHRPATRSSVTPIMSKDQSR